MPWLRWVISHRGANREAPENTLAAFDRACKYPINGIEFDVQLSKDGVPIIYHDSHLARIDKGVKRNLGNKGVNDLSYPKLRALDWGGWFSKKYRGQRVPTLKQVLARYSAKTCLFIEFKVYDCQHTDSYAARMLARSLKLIDSLCSSTLEQIFILSFDMNLLALSFKIAPHLNYILNLEEIPNFASIEGTNLKIEDFYGYCLPIEQLDTDFVNASHRRGQCVLTYSCDSKSQAEKACALSVDGIMTNNPAVFFKSLPGLLMPCDNPLT